jgi:iron complex outermembrane receptor protein
VQGAFVYQTSERIYLMDAENSLLGDHLGAYGTTNFTTGIDHGNYSVELFVSNAFDRRALANRYTQCPVAVCAAPEVRNGGLVYDTPIQPRVIGLQFGQKF